MKLSEFLLSDEAEMKLAVLHQGVLVAKRHNPEYFVFLFQMEGFYVETYCNRLNKAVSEYRVFKNVNSLTPYLEAIAIDHLLQ